MNSPNISSGVDSHQVRQIINSIKGFEQSRDYTAAITEFAPLWSNIEEFPDFSGFDQATEAELYRLSGYLLLNFGHARNNAKLKIRGEEFLTVAAKLFSEIDDADSMFEAQIMIAFARAQNGNLQKCEYILGKVERYYKSDKHHPNYFLAQVNRLYALFYAKKTIVAKDLIDRIKFDVEKFASNKIKSQFYVQSGIIYWELNLLKESIAFYQKASVCADQLKNERFKTHIYNNLAMVYKNLKNYPEALSAVEKALKISRKLDEYWWLAHYSDTKAQIYYDMGNFKQSLEIIKKSIFYFRSGEDPLGLLAALWIKVKILFQMGLSDQAKAEFHQLLIIARTKCDQTVLDLYQEQFYSFIKLFVPRFQESKDEIFEVKCDDFYQINRHIPRDKNLKFYLVPGSVSQKLYRIKKDLMVAVVHEELTDGDFVMFRLNGSNLSGKIVKKDGWFVVETLSGKEIAVNYVTSLKKICAVNVVEEIKQIKNFDSKQVKY